MEGYREGICPCCKSEDLEYGKVVLKSGYLYYPVECKSCGATGKEYYNIEFTDIIMEIIQ